MGVVTIVATEVKCDLRGKKNARKQILKRERDDSWEFHFVIEWIKERNARNSG